MSKIVSSKSLLHGILCCFVVLFTAILINQIYPVDKIITTIVSLMSMVLPSIVEKLASLKIDGHDEIILNEIEKINTKLNDFSEQVNLNENSIIEIQSVLTCFNNPKVLEDIIQLKIDMEILKERIKQ
jgi:hypothetical protein